MVATLRSLRSLSVLIASFAVSPLLAGEPCTVSGVYTVDGQQTKLTHAWIHAKDNPFDKSKTDAVVLLAAEALPAEEAGDVFALMKRSSSGKLRAIEIRIDDEGDVISGQLYHDAFAKFGGSFSASGMHKFTADAPAGSFGGKAGSGGDSEFDGLRWSYEATFRCPPPVKAAAAPPAKLAGKALPAGGGDPGKAYLAFSKAVAKGDVKALRALASAERAKQMDGPEFEEMLPVVQAMQPSNVKIVSGSVDGSKATLLLAGTTDGAPSEGKVDLVLENGAWKVQKESWSTRDRH